VSPTSSRATTALVRRAALLAHPLGPPPRALAARLQTEEIRIAGGALRFEPRIARHAPLRRLADGSAGCGANVGYRAIRVRQLDPRLPFAWMTRLGALSIPLIVAVRIVDSCRDLLRVGRQYGVRWFELRARSPPPSPSTCSRSAACGGARPTGAREHPARRERGRCGSWSTSNLNRRLSRRGFVNQMAR